MKQLQEHETLTMLVVFIGHENVIKSASIKIFGVVDLTVTRRLKDKRL